MGNRIIAAGLAGWAGIIALSWWLADQRIEMCEYSDENCVIRTTAARDFVLVVGLTVALVVIVGAALVWVRRGGRVSFNWPRGNRPKIKQAPIIVDLRPSSSPRGFALEFARASIPFVFAIAVLVAVVLYYKPGPAPAWASAPVVTPVEGDPFADAPMAPTEVEGVERQDRRGAFDDLIPATGAATNQAAEVPAEAPAADFK